ncbi:Replication termination factor 2 [Trypanosoma melophagium]|uniref:Replication termination factor 2 n=1 Tax=Trypanosoma melophagium TaxID=715481 RepID=UPI00351A9B87|nr:Replication termination factor 2 [Trypanosoma melophagium]
MGGDGQALSNKRRVLESSKVFVTADELRKEERKGSDLIQTIKEQNAQRWSHCTLSLEPLEMPVVFDLCGRLYSKRILLDDILRRKRQATAKEKNSNNGIYITRLSDVCEISNIEEGEKVVIRCPLTGFDASYGIHTFVGFWGCGHVLCASYDTLMKSNETKLLVSTEEPAIVSCPFCGEDSFPVSLVLGSKDDEVEQFRRLRPLQRMFTKRKRDEK